MKKLSYKNRLFTGILFILAVLSISNSCTKDDNKDTTGGPGANEVWIQNFAFSPASITVSVGTRVTWTNKDGTAHTVTSNSNFFDSGNIANGGSFSFTFTAPGSYPYYCRYHPNMTATVVVN
jgi:plastocyanin